MAEVMLVTNGLEATLPFWIIKEYKYSFKVIISPVLDVPTFMPRIAWVIGEVIKIAIIALVKIIAKCTREQHL